MVSKAETSDTPPRTRRRGEALAAAILDAAWAELAATGYDGVTMEGVARRAGTSKAVLYRRWPNRATLLLAAFRRVVVPVADKVPDTGSLRGDLIATLEILRGHLEVLDEASPGAVHSFMRDIQTLLPEVESLTPAVMRHLLERARKRGEIGPDEVPERVLRLPLDLNRHEVLITGKAPTDQGIEEIVDLIALPALRAATHPAD